MGRFRTIHIYKMDYYEYHFILLGSELYIMNAAIVKEHVQCECCIYQQSGYTFH